MHVLLRAATGYALWAAVVGRQFCAAGLCSVLLHTRERRKRPIACHRRSPPLG
jgi:hypothetical protein